MYISPGNQHHNLEGSRDISDLMSALNSKLLIYLTLQTPSHERNIQSLEIPAECYQMRNTYVNGIFVVNIVLFLNGTAAKHCLEDSLASGTKNYISQNK